MTVLDDFIFSDCQKIQYPWPKRRAPASGPRAERAAGTGGGEGRAAASAKVRGGQLAGRVNCGPPVHMPALVDARIRQKENLP
jgi:hypothetical protein